MDLIEFANPVTGRRFAVPLGKFVAVVETGAKDQCELVLADGQCWPVTGGYGETVAKVGAAFMRIRGNRSKPQ